MDTIPNLLHGSPGARAIYACRGRTTDFGQLDAESILRPVILAVSLVLARKVWWRRQIDRFACHFAYWPAYLRSHRGTQSPDLARADNYCCLGTIPVLMKIIR